MAHRTNSAFRNVWRDKETTMSTTVTQVVFCLVATLSAALSARSAALQVRRIHGAAPAGTVEIRGLRAGAFNPVNWRAGRLHLVPDVRSPFLEPRPGQWRNIYAPAIVPNGKGYRVYYGGWDGSETGNDRIYTTTADADFTTLGPRSLVIDKGPFIHVNNCSAVRTADGRVTMLTTCYPVGGNTNKPGVFTSPNGMAFNGSASYSPAMSDLVSLSGYASFEKADINGMNVLLRDGAKWRLYFGDFTNFGKVHRASSTDARNWTYDGAVVDAAMMVNDVKPFRVSGKTWYLMLLHQNADKISVSVSTDSSRFPTPATLFRNLGDEDRYMVACGLVTDGKAAFGVLYGAGATKSLDQNRIFARWLQRKVVFRTAGKNIAATARAFGPDRLRITLPSGVKTVTGRLTLMSEDGITPIGSVGTVTLRAGETISISHRKHIPPSGRQPVVRDH